MGGRPDRTSRPVVIRDPRQRLVALEGGAIDVAETLQPEDLQFVALHPELTLLQVAANNVGYMAMDTQHPPFDDVRVRRAVNYAINKTALVKLIYQALGCPASSPLPPSLWSHVDEDLYHYDRAEAMRLLAEAHYVQPKKRLKLYVIDTQRPYMPAPETVARIIQHNLRDVGMDVEIVVNDFDTHVHLTQNGVHDLCCSAGRPTPWTPTTSSMCSSIRRTPSRAWRAISRSSRTPSCTASVLGARVDRSGRARALLPARAGSHRAGGAVGAAGLWRGRRRRSQEPEEPACPPVGQRLLPGGLPPMSASHTMSSIVPTPRRRATDCVRAQPVGLFGYLRLRHKLALMLTIAALLPVLGASTVAMRLVLAGLKSGVHTQTERTMRVALNLVLANVKEVFEEASASRSRRA